MILNIFRIFLLLIVLQSHALGQVRNANIGNAWSITISPSALFNNFPGLQMGIEKSINGFAKLELEGAYLFTVPGPLELSKSGTRIKLGLKSLIGDEFFFMVTLYYRRTVHRHFNRVARADFAYFERLDYQKIKRLIGPTIGFAKYVEMGKRLTIEGGFNIGAGVYKVSFDDFPEDAIELDNNFFGGYDDPDNYFYPIIGLSLKLKYLLNNAPSKKEKQIEISTMRW